MKPITIFAIAILFLLPYSCRDKEDPPAVQQGIDCEILKDGLISLEEGPVETELNKLSQDYLPAPFAGDEIGHAANLDSIIVNLNNQCAGIAATLGCYACLESFPAQSVINFTVDSAGTEVKRGIRLLTPDSGPMTFQGMCGY